jgi:Uma2 family endonuclease
MNSPLEAVSTTEFETFVQLPENAYKRFELINGAIIDMTANQKSSNIAAIIIWSLMNAVFENDLGDVTVPDGGYAIGDDRLLPDVAFVLRHRQSVVPNVTYNPLLPDFVAEVVSPSDLRNPKDRITAKLELYQRVKIPLLWFVFPHRQEVDVYIDGEFSHTATKLDRLDGGDVIPNWTLEVSRLFK